MNVCDMDVNGLAWNISAHQDFRYFNSLLKLLKEESPRSDNDNENEEIDPRRNSIHDPNQVS